MRIALGSDETTHLTDFVADELVRRGHEVVPAGALASGDDPRWPVVGAKVGRMFAAGACDEGILFCFTGIGVSMAANKVAGGRAALCADHALGGGWPPPRRPVRCLTHVRRGVRCE